MQVQKNMIMKSRKGKKRNYLDLRGNPLNRKVSANGVQSKRGCLDLVWEFSKVPRINWRK